MNRIDELFERKKAGILSVFYTAGYPKLSDTVPIARWLGSAGVDMLELGIPFSDPVADGPVIQASSKTALENGMTLKLLLEQVKEIRKSASIPILLMGYVNTVMRFGFEKFCAEASKAGADGVILPDLPLEEFQNEYRRYFDSSNLKAVFLVTPQTPEPRLRLIDSLCGGFVYAVSASSTTGAKDDFTSEQTEYFSRLKRAGLKRPILIGFGVSNRTTFSEVCNHSAGAIVGSAFVARLKGAENLEATVRKFVAEFTHPADQAASSRA